LHGIKSIAVSTETLENSLEFFVSQAMKVQDMFESLMSSPSLLLNVNISVKPNAPIRWAPLGKRIYRSSVEKRVSPRGTPYCWIGGPPIGYQGSDDCDVALFENGFSTITPLSLDGTHHQELKDLLKK